MCLISLIIGPDGEKAQKPFTLTMSYEKDQFSSDEVDIYYYNEDQGLWIEQNGTVNEEEGTITVEVDHFSTYGVLSKDTSSILEDKESNEDKDSNDDIVINPEDQDSNAENALPKTAINVFNMIAIGLILLVLGGISLIFICNKVITK